MSVLAALTPPFLMCAVVIVAIVAFLRHEMGRGRARRAVGDEEDTPAPPTAAAGRADDAGSDVGGAAATSRDG
jgi:hypothetical protein